MTSTISLVLAVLSAVGVLAVPIGVGMLLGRAGTTVSVVIAGCIGGIAPVARVVALADPSALAPRILEVSMSGALTATMAIVLARRFARATAVAVAAVWSVFVLQPALHATLAGRPSLLETAIGAVDYSATLATHVAPAAFLVALSVVVRPAATPAPVATETMTRSRAAIAALAVGLGGFSWMLGIEGHLSEASGRIALNAIAALAIAALVWVGTARVANRPAMRGGTTAGVILGWASVGMGQAFLSPVALVSSVVIGVAASTAIAVRGDRALRRAPLAVIVAVAIGGVLLALLADGFGMSATGSTALVAAQLGAIGLVAAWSIVVGVACAAAILGARAIRRRWWAIPDSN